MPFLRKYNTATTIENIPLITRGSVDYKVNPTIDSSADVQIRRDTSAFAIMETLPTVSPAGTTSVKITLSAAEMLAKQIVVRFIDTTATKEWEDNEIIIETYGHANAQYKFDFDSIYLDAAITSRSTISISDIYNHVVEGTLTFEQFQRIMFAALAGKSTGGGSSSVAFKDIAGSGDRINATVDSNGNRTAITVIGS